MTDETLRDLLEERVADLATRDLAATAWSEGVRRRRTRRAGVLAGVAAATALVVGVAALVGGPGPDDPPPSERPTSAAPDAVVRGAHVWWSPDLAEEAVLPQVSGPLPEQVDLDAQAPDAAGANGAPALAAFAVLDGSRADHVLLVGNGPVRRLDVSQLATVAKPNGYRVPPVSRTMLSPDGRTLAFGQDGAIAFFDITLGSWREVPVDGPTHQLTWVGPRLLVLANGDGLSVDGRPVDLDLPRLTVLGMIDPATPQGPWVHSADGLAHAQAFGYGAQVPTRPDYAQQPETLVVQTAGTPDVLAIAAETNDGRFKDCCPVAGWLDGDTVVYESRSARPRLVSWDVGTRTFGRVTTIVGGAAPDASWVGSYAQLDVASTDTSAPEPETDGPDAVAGDMQVWWGPTAADEAGLPSYDGAPLPRTIDLDPAAPAPAQDRVRAVLAPGGPRAVVLSESGTTGFLDIARLEPVSDEAGNRGDPLAAGPGLDPAGNVVAFAQNSSLEVYSFVTRTWTTVDTDDWAAEGARWFRPGVLILPSGDTYGVDGTPHGRREVDGKDPAREGDAPYGPVSVVEGAVAQTLRLAGPVAGGDLANPEAVVVQRGAERFALALPSDGRAKGCCPVVGLLDDRTALFRSGDAVLAWTVGTHDVSVVSEVVGASGWAASFSDLS